MLIQKGHCARSFVLGEPEGGERAQLAMVNNIRVQSKSLSSEPSKQLPTETHFLLDFFREFGIILFGDIG